jgi:uncharacterized spore protein YtfJ
MTLEQKMKEVIDKVGRAANVRAVFGEPYEKDGVTIIPVAKIFFSSGGGEGWGPMKQWRRGSTSLREENEALEKPAEEDSPAEGMGRGFGSMAKSMPIGYIRIIDGEAMFIETLDKTKIIIGGMILAGFSLIIMKKIFGRSRCHKQEKQPI